LHTSVNQLSYTSPEAAWKNRHKDRRIGTKTRDCLRELHSLTVSKSVRFLYSEGTAGTLNYPYSGLKTYSFQRMNPQEAVPSQAVPRQVLSAPVGKLRRFCPIYDFSSDNSAVSRSCLQADTGVIRLQPYLRQTSLNFLKWVCFTFF